MTIHAQVSRTLTIIASFAAAVALGVAGYVGPSPLAANAAVMLFILTLCYVGLGKLADALEEDDRTRVGETTQQRLDLLAYRRQELADLRARDARRERLSRKDVA